MFELLPIIAGALAGSCTRAAVTTRYAPPLSWVVAAMAGVAVSLVAGEHQVSLAFPLVDALLGSAGLLAVRAAQAARAARVAGAARPAA